MSLRTSWVTQKDTIQWEGKKRGVGRKLKKRGGGRKKGEGGENHLCVQILGIKTMLGAS